jgi:multiple sugar transport system permease protein
MKRSLTEKLLLGLGIVAGVVLSLGPFLWFSLIALKTPLEVTAVPPTIFPATVSVHAFKAAVEQYGLLHFLKNSIIVAGVTTMCCITIGTLAAYALARLRIRFKGTILLALLAVGMFPQISVAGPVWRILRALGWLNTYQGLIIPYIALTLPLSVWILANFFKDLPAELEDSARVDGATLIQTLTKVIVPLAAPGVFTAAILVFIYAWNEFFFALLIMTQREWQTLPVGIALFPGEYTMPWAEIAAASLVATLPLIAMVVIFQRRIISGLTAGAVKG